MCLKGRKFTCKRCHEGSPPLIEVSSPLLAPHHNLSTNPFTYNKQDCAKCDRSLNGRAVVVECKKCKQRFHKSCTHLTRFGIDKLIKTTGKESFECKACLNNEEEIVTTITEPQPHNAEPSKPLRCAASKCLKRNIRKTDRHLSCTTCDAKFHLHLRCSGMTRKQEERLDKSRWSCDGCNGLVANPHPTPLQSDEINYSSKDPNNTTNKLIILQWNADSLLSKKEELKNFVQDNDIDIYVVQETKMKPNDTTPTIPGYTIVRKDREQKMGQHNTAGGGVLIGIRDTIPFRQCNIQARGEGDTTTEWATIEIPVKGKNKIRLTNLYIPPVTSNPTAAPYVTPNAWPNKDYDIILGDINAHSILWDSKVSPDDRGEAVEEWLANNSMHVLNTGESTRYSRNTDSDSAPDVSIVHTSRLDKFTWKVVQDLQSDHRPLIITYEDTFNMPKVNTTPLYKWNLKKADWVSYEQHINDKIPAHYKAKNINKLTNILCKSIVTSANKNIGKKKVDHRTKPWMTDELKAEIHNRNVLSKNIATNREAWKLACQKVAIMTKEEKTRSWKEYVESMDTSTSDTQVWKTIRSMDGRKPPTNKNEALVVDNKAYTSDADKANQFANTYKSFSKIPVRKEDRAIRRSVRNKLRERLSSGENCEQEFTMKEMEDVINNTKPHKASGEDDIPYELIKHLPEAAKVLLLHLYNKCWLGDGVPRKWKTAVIRPLLKDGKDPKQTTSYRPISLTSCLGKILEKMVADRLLYQLEAKLQLSQNQAGFRQGRSTADQVLKLTQSAIDKFHGPKGATLTIATFFDYEKAFDKVWRDGLLYKMIDLGIPPRFLHYVRHFLGSRKTKVQVNNVRSKNFFLNEGLPQGSAISPLLFLIFINDIDADLHPRTLASLFADDTAIWVQGTNAKETTRDRMQVEVEKIAAWAKKWKMSINVGKTKSLNMSTSNEVIKWNPKLQLNGAPIEKTEEYKFLGVTIDAGLRFNKHIDNSIRKCSKRINILKCLAGKDWGQQLESQRKIYITYIRSCLEYASPTWWQCASPTAKKKLNKLQNVALRSISGLYKTAPIDFLHLECNLEPLDLRLDKIDRICQDKYSRLPTRDARSKLVNPNAPNRLDTREGWSHSMRNVALLHLATIDEKEIQTIPPWQHMNNLFVDEVHLDKAKSEYTPHALREKSLEKIASFSVDYIVYTDGSTDSNQENGGAGVYAEDANNNPVMEQHEPAGRYCSSYGGECAALYHAMIWMRKCTDDTTTHKLSFLVCTDSKSLCQALANISWHSRDYWLIKIQEQMHQLDADVHLLWIPSHCDVDGNEKADELANQGTSDDQTGVPVSPKITKAKIKQAKWTVTHTRALEIFGDKRCPKYEIEKTWSRTVRTAFARIRSGHYKELKDYRHRILEQEDDPNCEECGVPETTEHVLCHCSTTEEARVRNWPGQVTMRMMRDEPSVCRRILQHRFPILRDEAQH